MSAGCPDFLVKLIEDFRLSPQAGLWLWEEPPNGLGLDCISDVSGAVNDEPGWEALLRKASAVGITDKTRMGARLKLM